MYRFIETIKIDSGTILNLRFHNLRLNATRKHFFGAHISSIQLEDFIVPPIFEKCLKCRVVYAEQIEDITYSVYQMREVKTLKLVFSNAIEYSYKSENREAIQKLFVERGLQDEVLIVRDGLLTDTSIANVALYNGSEWITPASSLLAGTKRAELLTHKIIREADIPVDSLFSYSKIALFNAMIDFKVLILPINKLTIF